ncbi:DNA-binding protein [Amycolatopsis coloradensis]|uniref:Holo-[acyl-carrier-protein] synthase n=1 Tax=Amycolatopsis coloradensis TaxID=76021 RepID=A0A1R0KE94_9PSEU|nr:4'-phosphopantetheinyl transferase superfamily protein [Amycolatopsis coloradensis]OLZ43395.1 DNA-binding protein [Amycolatopsis coloradensis]
MTRLGVDVLGVDELSALLNRPWFRRFVYAEEEIATAADFGPTRAQEFLAGRFAGKEAVIKVLRLGVRAGVTPAQIAILRDPDGFPSVRLRGGAALRAAQLNIGAVHLSLAHKGNLVVAVAVATDAAEL